MTSRPATAATSTASSTTTDQVEAVTGTAPRSGDAVPDRAAVPSLVSTVKIGSNQSSSVVRMTSKWSVNCIACSRFWAARRPLPRPNSDPQGPCALRCRREMRLRRCHRREGWATPPRDAMQLTHQCAYATSGRTRKRSRRGPRRSPAGDPWTSPQPVRTEPRRASA